MKKLLATTLLLGILGVSFAQDYQDQDPKAKKVLDQMSEKAQTYKSFQADFESKVINEQDGIDISQSGTIQVKEKKYRIELDDQILIGDGSYLWVVTPSENEALKNDLPDPSDFDVTQDPSKLFKLYDSNFKYQYVEDKNGQHHINLFPIKASEAQFHTIKLAIDKETLYIDRIEIKGKESNVFTYNIKNFKGNVDVPDSKLKFNKADYPDIEINDLTEE